MSARLVVFDLDGTLVDSLRDLAESANQILSEYGCRTFPDDEIGRMVGDGAATLVARAFAAADCPQPDDALPRFLAVYNARLLKWTRPYDGIPEALAAIAPHAPLAVLTNKPLHATREILAGVALDRFFPPAWVIGGDGPLPRKPDPAGLTTLARAAGVPVSRTVLVGDSMVDVRTARAAGATMCLAAWGFGFEGVRRAEQPVTGADVRIVKEPGELPQVVY